MRAHHVVAEPADERAGAGPGEERDRHFLDVVEDGGAQIEDQALADRRGQPPRHQRHPRLGDRNARDHQGQHHHDADGALADLVDDPSGQQWGGQAEERADHADPDEDTQPAMVPCGEPPDPGQQRAIGQRPQIAALGVRLPVQRLPRYRFKAH